MSFLAISFVRVKTMFLAVLWWFHINDAGLTADFERKRTIVMEYPPRINILQKHIGIAHQV